MSNINTKDVNITQSQNINDDDSSEEEFTPVKKNLTYGEQQQQQKPSTSSVRKFQISQESISLKQLPKKNIHLTDESTNPTSHETQEFLTLSGEIETDFFSKPPVEDIPPILRKQTISTANTSSITQNKSKSNHIENLIKQWEKPKKKSLPKPSFLLSQPTPPEKIQKTTRFRDIEEDDLIYEKPTSMTKKNPKEIDLKRKKSKNEEISSKIETPTKKQKKEKKSNFEPNLLTVVYEDVKKEKPNLTYGKLAQYDLTGDESISDVIAKRTIPTPTKTKQSNFQIKKIFLKSQGWICIILLSF